MNEDMSALVECHSKILDSLFAQHDAREAYLVSLFLFCSNYQDTKNDLLPLRTVYQNHGMFHTQNFIFQLTNQRRGSLQDHLLSDPTLKYLRKVIKGEYDNLIILTNAIQQHMSRFSKITPLNTRVNFNKDEELHDNFNNLRQHYLNSLEYFKCMMPNPIPQLRFGEELLPFATPSPNDPNVTIVDPNIDVRSRSRSSSSSN